MKQSILILATLVAMGGMLDAAENDAYRLSATVPSGQSILLSQGYVAVAAPAQDKVLLLDSVGNPTVLAGGDSGDTDALAASSDAALHGPSALTADAQGNVFIAETGNHRVRRIDAQTHAVTTVAGTGVAGFDGDGQLGTAASLDSPSGLAVDSLGNLFISDTGNHRIRRVDVQTGVISTVVGTGEAGFEAETLPGVAARLNGPTGIAYDKRRARLLIADTGNHAVRALDTRGMLNTLAGVGRPGFSGDGGPATEARFLAPTGVGADASGNVYVNDSGNRMVRCITSVGMVASVGETLVVPMQAMASSVKGNYRIDISSPAAYAIWNVGTRQVVRWTHNLGASATFVVEVSRDGGISWVVIGKPAPGARSLAWMVTSPTSSSALIRVRNAKSTVAGVSPNFRIQQPE
jgi:sugar lactone lactonase YvrE